MHARLPVATPSMLAQEVKEVVEVVIVMVEVVSDGGGGESVMVEVVMVIKYSKFLWM